MTGPAAGAVWEAYRAYVAHVHPSEASGREPCWACMRADFPAGGCPDGVALYDVYRLAKIERSTTKAR